MSNIFGSQTQEHVAALQLQLGEGDRSAFIMSINSLQFGVLCLQTECAAAAEEAYKRRALQVDMYSHAFHTGEKTGLATFMFLFPFWAGQMGSMSGILWRCKITSIIERIFPLLRMRRDEG